MEKVKPKSSTKCKGSVIIETLEKLEPEVKKVLNYYGAKSKESLVKSYKGVLALSILSQSPAMLTFRNKVDHKAAVNQLNVILNQVVLVHTLSVEKPELFSEDAVMFINNNIKYMKDCFNTLIVSTDYI